MRDRGAEQSARSAAILYGIPAIIVAVPWLVTLYLVQAFAWRIAVLENRHAIDAIGEGAALPARPADSRAR